ADSKSDFTQPSGVCGWQTHLGRAALNSRMAEMFCDCESIADFAIENSNYARHRTQSEIDTAKFPGLPPGRERRGLGGKRSLPRDSVPQAASARWRSRSDTIVTRGIGQTGEGQFCHRPGQRQACPGASEC